MIRWLASYPKSGNTWMRLLMMAYEHGDAFDINRRYRSYKQDTSESFYKRISPVPLEKLTEGEYHALRPAALVNMVHDVKGPLMLKTHCANITLDRTALIPRGLTECALYVVRDPRDVAVSLADHLGVSIDAAIDVMADQKRTLGTAGKIQVISSWSVSVQSWFSSAFPTYILRYEDLKADTAGHFEKVAKFFGIVPDRLRIARAVAATSFDRLQAAEKEAGFKAKSGHQERFFRSGVAGGWKGTLSPAQARKIETEHREAMELCGYC